MRRPRFDEHGSGLTPAYIAIAIGALAIAALRTAEVIVDHMEERIVEWPNLTNGDD